MSPVNPSIEPIPNPRAKPHGEVAGIVDEYGTIWDGEPGADDSIVIGDIVPRNDQETFTLYIER